MADSGRSADCPMNIVTRSAFDRLLGSLEHSCERRSRTHCRSGNEVRVCELGCRVAYANGMHVREVRAAANRFNSETRGVGTDAAVPVECRLAIALIDGDGAVVATQAGDG